MPTAMPLLCATARYTPALHCAAASKSWENSSRQRRRNVLAYNGVRIGWDKALISSSASAPSAARGGGSVSEMDDGARKLLRVVLWVLEGVYVIWLFLLPYAPGEPVWAITSETIQSLIQLSLNFFFVLPSLNSVGIHVMEAPIVHPICEGLFNLVIGWTLLFAPLLYTDRRRNRVKPSTLDFLWGLQAFLTNTFLIPYMALRLNGADEEENAPSRTSQLGLIMTNGATIVGLIGGFVSLLSVWWGFYGRGDGNFGDVHQRWEFFLNYVSTDRVAYAFVWDLCLYSVFQAWLIGDNMQKLQSDRISLLSLLRFVPVVGSVAYSVCLKSDDSEM